MADQSLSALEQSFFGKRILITGGLGFIGSNLARRLADAGAHLILVDSLIPDYGGNLFNIDGYADRVNVNIADVRDEYSMDYLVQGQDILFNLAGQTSHLDSMRDPYTDLEINVRSQLSILEACRKKNPGIKIVYASTRQFYGKPDYLPVDERHLLHPTDVNGVNKMAGEWYHIIYNNIYGIRATSLRLTNTYGPRMRLEDGRVVPNFIPQALRGEPLTVYGDGQQTRSFCYCSDLIEGIYRLLMSAEHDPVNIGNPNELTILQFAETINRLTGNPAGIVFQPEKRIKDDPQTRQPDIAKARALLNWEPQVQLETGLSRTIEYFRNRI